MSTQPKALSVPDSAIYTGLSKRTIERLLQRGDITPTRVIGVRRTLIPVSELDRILKEGREDVPAIVPTIGHNVAVIGGKGRRG